jgi:fatty-acyl-CoA synthase
MPTLYFFRSPSSRYKPSYIHCPGDEPLFALTLGQLVEKAAEQWGEREALVSVYENKRYSFRELLEKVTCYLHTCIVK